jgi:hypothetical protein
LAETSTHYYGQRVSRNNIYVQRRLRGQGAGKELQTSSLARDVELPHRIEAVQVRPNRSAVVRDSHSIRLVADED